MKEEERMRREDNITRRIEKTLNDNQRMLEDTEKWQKLIV